MNAATRIPSRARALLAALLATILVVSGLSLAAQPANAATGDVSGATLEWGVKASFRNYITGAIAKGTVTLGGNVTGAGPYAWTGGTGAASQSASTGNVGYTGSIHFSGHGGALDLTISDVHVKQTSATAAQLVVDVYSNSMADPTVFTQANDIVFGTVDLAAATVASTANAVAYTAAPAVLTGVGADAFAGFYGAGEALDPISFTWPVEQAPVAQPAAPTTTVLVAPATATVGAVVSLSATIAPSAAAGTLTFFDGTTAIGTSAVVSGASAFSATFATAGSHSIKAEFTPADPALFLTSTSVAVVTVNSVPPVVTTPTVAVSKKTVSSVGEIVTVTGAGFSPAGTATNAARPPLAGKFAGVYVTFGKFADVWKVSEGAASTTRVADRAGTKWVVNPADVGTVGGAAAGGVAINADGTFSVEILVKPGFSGEPATGNYGIYTYPGGGLSYAPFETYTPIAFVETPTVAVSKKTVSSVGEIVTVTGAGFSPVGTATNAARPPLAGKFAGVYVTFGKFADVWKVSEGAASTTRVADRAGTKWVVNPADVGTVGGAAAGGVAINADGTFSVEILVKPGFSGEPVTGNYGIYTYPGGGLSYAPFETYTPITFVDAAITTTALAADPASIIVGATTTLTAQLAPIAAGSVTFRLGTTTLGTAAVSANGTASLPVASLPVGSHAFTATFTPTSPLLYTTSSGTTSVTVADKPVVGAGSLSWGVKESFRSYITSPIAKGAISTSGVSSSGGIFTFGQSSGGSFDRATGVGTSNYSGSVRFTGHAGVLDVTLANPVVRIDSATSATLLVNVNGAAASPIAILNLAAGSLSTPNNTVSYSGVPATLTSQGAAAFSLNGSGFYEVGAALDPVSFVIGSPSTVSTAIGATVASFAAPRTPTATPPATTGLSVAEGSSLVEGGEVTITASGFKPNETGILVVIYSAPTVLATNATADAAGVVTWTGKLPAGLTGQHTLTLQGSVNRGIAVTIAAASATASGVSGCVVDDATITWGFKESFRAYISGSIAHGEWTVADGATYAVPNFGFAGGTGGYDRASGEGLLAFAGSITFTGHGGVLNTTVANPQIRFDGADTAYLLLDLSGTTQDGAAIDSKAVEFAKIDLAGALENNDGTVNISAAPATLTAAGAAAFGTYPEGEALDPITVAFTTAADCAAAMSGTAEPRDAMAVEAVSADKPMDFGWIIWVALALLVVAALVVALVVVRRRRA